MAGTVSMTGFVSNTNWTSLIEDMLNAQKTAIIKPLEKSKTSYQAKLTAWQNFNSTLSAIVNYIDNNNLDEDAGYALHNHSFYSADPAVTPSSILTATIGTVTGPGRYSIEVTDLAEAEKIASDVFATGSTALGIAGDILVNGKNVTLEATDTLIGVAQRINTANAGVTATVLSLSDTEYRLLLESGETGAGGLSLRNGSSSNVLESLNLRAGPEQLAHSTGADGTSDLYSSKTDAAGTLLGLTTAESGTIRIRGTDDVWKDVAVNLATDSLETIATNINLAAPTGVTASVEEVTEDGTTRFRLKLTNIEAADLEDDRNLLETLGFLESSNKNTLRTGKDAILKVDGYSVTSSSNTVSGVIEGVTLNLLGTNTGKPIELRISADNSQVSQKVNTLVTNINTALTFVKDQNTAGSSKPLMGEVNLSVVRRVISDALYNTVDGNTTYTNASSIGISFTKEGTISLDSSRLSAALSANRGEALGVLKSLADTLRENLNLYADPATGTLVSVKNSIQSTIDRIESKIEDVNDRFERQREVLEKKYNALEALISRSNLMRTWLTQQVKALTGNSAS